MAIQLAVTDTTGVDLPQSYHMITAVHTDGLAQTALLKIQMWASVNAFLSGKAPLTYDGWGRDFYLINLSQDEYAAIANDLVLQSDVGLPAKTVMLKRAYIWLMQQNVERTGYFDYTQGIVV